MGTYSPPPTKKELINQLTHIQPGSAYNIIIEVPATSSSLLFKNERAIRPGFSYVNLPSARLLLKTKKDALIKPTSSLEVTATTP